MTISTLDYQAVLRIVYQWPAQQRFVLLQDLLNTLAPVEYVASRPKSSTLIRALGLLNSGQPAPSDAQIDTWLNEHRMERHT